MPADKTFIDFLKSAPAAKDAGKTTVLTGTVYRGDTDDKFTLVSSDGQTTELAIEAVQKFKIVDQTGLNAIVQLEISIVAGPYTLKELIKDPPFDTRKETVYDTYKEVIKEPIKEPIFDPPGTLWSDPPGGTIREGIDFGDPSQGVVNPAIQQQYMQQGGMMPFIMATPHHASAAAVAQQPGMHVHAQPGMHVHTTYVAEHAAPKSVIADQHVTRKELIWDNTQKEPIFDPHTRWEGGGGGTMQEGVGNPGQFDQPVWNLPGMMF